MAKKENTPEKPKPFDPFGKRAPRRAGSGLQKVNPLDKKPKPDA